MTRKPSLRFPTVFDQPLTNSNNNHGNSLPSTLSSLEWFGWREPATRWFASHAVIILIVLVIVVISIGIIIIVTIIIVIIQ